MSDTSFTSYAVLGSGRLARHFAFYLRSLNLPLLQWSRNGDPAFNSRENVDTERRLQEVLQRCSHVVLAVKDEGIESLSKFLKPENTAVHFSGALNLNRVAAAHPLMTFGAELESLDWYRQIPFVLDHGQKLENILPGLPNTSFHVEPEQRAYYHALCSLAGNSSYLLWRSIGDVFEKDLKLPAKLLKPFLHQVVSNSSSDQMQNFTGPVARGDWNVVKSHLESLKGQPDLLSAYKGYLEMAQSNGVAVPQDLL